MLEPRWMSASNEIYLPKGKKASIDFAIVLLI